ncbi:MAG TPA: OmpA family protein [Kofleriaceae bacterium]|nr:OmpA family protein [Kofleriaceae bacterium]
MHTKQHLPEVVRGAAMGAALLLLVPLAHAQDADLDDSRSAEPARGLAPGLELSVRIEPGVATALTDPQADLAGTGFGQTVKVMFGVSRFLAVGPAATFTTLPSTDEMASARNAWSFGAGARLMRPHDAAPGRRGIHALSPWLDADLLYVRTGDLGRPGFAAGVGAAVPLDDNRRFWLGPYVRYAHILQGERADYDDRDAKLLTVGLGLEIGTGLERRRMYVAAVVPPAERVPVEPAAVADRDGDGVADGDDLCPDVAGLAADRGCPPYVQVVVEPDKLELKQHIAFAWDSADLEDDSRPLLDEVVRALDDNRGFKVEIDGNASSDGADPHNQTLSEARADAVRDYLVAHGIAAQRLIARGFGSTAPSQSNDTRGGRVANRRVEFVVSFIIVDKGTTP